MSVSKKKVLSDYKSHIGDKDKSRHPQALRQEIDSNKFDLEIVYTQYGGHATVLSNQAVESRYAYVLSVGGDGTCNEIAKTLIHTDTVLGIIPTGSGKRFSPASGYSHENTGCHQAGQCRTFGNRRLLSG